MQSAEWGKFGDAAANPPVQHCPATVSNGHQAPLQVRYPTFMDAGATFVEKGARRDNSARTARLLAGFCLDGIIESHLSTMAPLWESFLIGVRFWIGVRLVCIGTARSE